MGIYFEFFQSSLAYLNFSASVTQKTKILKLDWHTIIRFARLNKSLKVGVAGTRRTHGKLTWDPGMVRWISLRSIACSANAKTTTH